MYNKWLKKIFYAIFCMRAQKYLETLFLYARKLTLKSMILYMVSPINRCWWQILEIKSVGDKFEMLVTESIILMSGNDIQKMSPTSKWCNKHPEIAIAFMSLYSTYHLLVSFTGMFVGFPGNTSLILSFRSWGYQKWFIRYNLLDTI